ncbi:helix-turn-helix domain-containing protein [Streptomyces sp. NPDC055036]
MTSVTTSAVPPVGQVVLGAHLRALREQAGLSQDAAGKIRKSGALPLGDSLTRPPAPDATPGNRSRNTLQSSPLRPKRFVMPRDLLTNFPRLFEGVPWGSPVEVYAVTKYSGTRNQGRGSRTVRWGADTHLVSLICEIEGDIEARLLAIDVPTDADALVVVAEGSSHETGPDGTHGVFEIRYFHGVTRMGETDTLIIYRERDIPAQFDNAVGPTTVCIKHLLGAPQTRVMPVREWLAAVAASRASTYLSGWNENAAPGEAPPWIRVKYKNRSPEEFFASQLRRLVIGAVASICWEASGEGEALPPDIRRSMGRGITDTKSEFDEPLAVAAARALTRLTWPELVATSESDDLLPFRKSTAETVPGIILGQCAAIAQKPAEVTLGQWSPYASQAGVNNTLGILKSTGWLSE